MLFPEPSIPSTTISAPGILALGRGYLFRVGLRGIQNIGSNCRHGVSAALVFMILRNPAIQSEKKCGLVNDSIAATQQTIGAATAISRAQTRYPESACWAADSRGGLEADGDKFQQGTCRQAGHKVKLAKYDPARHSGVEKRPQDEGEPRKALKKIDDLQYVLYAERKRAVLIVLQGLDAAGKRRHDPPRHVRHQSAGLPRDFLQGSRRPKKPRTISFGAFTRPFPVFGDLGIFNRSHYEDVLVVRVHNLVPKEVWSRRYDADQSLRGNPASK